MREILFRGKRVDNGEWIEGVPIKTYDTEIGINLPLRYKAKNITLMNNDRVELCCAMDESAYFDTENYPIIDDETIGQYTGLTDKNGKKIFEGDILSGQLDDLFPTEESIYEVVWHDYGWHIRNNSGIDTADKEWIRQYFKVIGNIYDNPELMGGNTNG